MFKKVIVLLSLATLAQTASAYDLSKKFGLGLTGGYVTPLFGNPFNSKANSDFSYGVHGRYHFNDSFNMEVGVTRSTFNDTPKHFDNFNMLGVWRMNGQNAFSPVFGAGVGLTKIKNFAPHNLKLAGVLRGGLEYGVTQWFSAGFLVDYQYISKFLGAMPEKRIHVVTPQLALTWYFGGNDSALQRAETEIKEMKAEKTKETSSFVDESNLDSDDDGVKDPEDKCPSTPKGVKVNSIGCAMDEKATMQINVEFDSGKATLNSKYDDHMKEIAAFLTKYREIRVQIAGYTDNQGSVAKNVALSEARAKAVMNALIKEGIHKKRLTAKGFGPADPVADNSTAEGRQQNRRVVAVLSSRK